MKKEKNRRCLFCNKRFTTSDDNRICVKCHERYIEEFEDCPEGNFGEGIYSVCPGEGGKHDKGV